jgi:hypothetical protein
VTPFDPRLPLIAREAKVKTGHAYHCWHAMREPGFHVAAFADFAGLEVRHVTAIMAAIGIHAPLIAKREVTRGTRLPNDWQLPEGWKAWAMAQRCWHPEETEAEAELFANYWQAKSGAGAVKLAWEKTWRNWVRQSHRPNGTNTGRIVTQADKVASLVKRIAIYEKLGREAETLEMRAELARLESNVVPINRQINA